ncbi:uncharacterized protein HMPREF1541_10379 [Cyphellophora europaea CBS 101466]|uniref:Xylanolytic transcriptional activator regulatory domain-containing protein n=1 Tax=Cyphellophora europaea (strain CBS 101466) TaxID=1220924 RepID=W2S9W2_CYPE1|nr:uncharacterized protein HMPREF1541_10379 [Cyphellophora europaea CBS 101466]ETN44709.1 hypothetical protein HMPREF1541_10379 [Cyphellophora europaea CBS 101466]
MTPRTTSSDQFDTDHPTENSDGDEERPTHTSEIGTLKKLPNQSGTAWLGSSSGVYFVNTVRRAFTQAFATSQGLPASEDILTGEDSEGRSFNGPITDGPSTTDGLPHILSSSLGRLPDRKIALELVMSFFRVWHPVFPFLHGPSFLKDTELLYQRPTPPTFSGSRQAKGAHPPQDLRKIITFQLIINIASLDRSDIILPPESRIQSTADVTRVAGTLALDHDLATLQTLLAAQLYLVSTLAIRAASTVGGTIVKLIYHAGLHRCPLRYAQLTSEQCEIRKRIFWSAYALDRHCSLSLGDPNTIQDDDIDVCLSGKELHKAVARDLLPNPADEINLHFPAAARKTTLDADDEAAREDESPEAREKSLREAALISYVHWSRLTGRIIEIFHKSINHRFPKHEQIVYLTSDIETWWNDLPFFLTGEEPQNHTSASAPSPAGSESPQSQLANLSSFFKILYHRLLLLMSRPRLSLDQSTPEFQHGLQVCIRASRNILAGLKGHKTAGQSMFLPGLLSAAWMSGLIIAFACQLGKYPKARACADIHACLDLLTSMNDRWYTVKNCHKTLSLLLHNIQSRKASTNGLLSVAKNDMPSPTANDAPSNERASKRRRTETNPPKVQVANANSGIRRASTSRTDRDVDMNPDALSPSQMTDGTPGNTASNVSSPAVPTSNTNSAAEVRTAAGVAAAKQRHTPSGWSNSSIDATANPTTMYDLSAFINPTVTSSGSRMTSNGTGNSSLNSQFPYSSGSALYSTQQEMAFAQNSMQLPELPSTNTTANSTLPGMMEDPDPMFWGNMDYNLADVFGSATWEQMTAGTPLGGAHGAGWDAGGGPL